jgi:3-oxoacyl-[acyl-carrier protein] reductase
MKLEGMVAVITGAGGYSGQGTALRLAKEGAHMMVNDINIETAQEIVA